MICAKPYVVNGSAFGCGQCTPCRINRRRIWTHRIMLEAAQYEDNSFVTLTFDDDHMPADLSVRPADITSFMKRLRNHHDRKLRYFACGEYGENTFRPHYHLAIFNHPRCRHGQTNLRSVYCCPVCEAVSKAWPYGNILVGSLEQQSAAYIAGYVVKKMTGEFDPRLEGRRPEFARMSLRPGIGLGMMHELASTLMEHKLDERMIDVPLALQHGKSKFPLGRYLRRKLRTYIGQDESCPKEVLEAQREELRPLRESAFNNSRSFQEEVASAGAQRRLNMETRNRIYSKKKDTL